MLRSLREFLQWRAGDSIILAEANVLPETDMECFGEDGDRMHMMFNFQVNQNLFYALAAADCRPLVRALKATKPRPATAQWGLFLRNHDELDLGRLTEEQRQRVKQILIDLKIEHHVHPIAVLTEIFHIRLGENVGFGQNDGVPFAPLQELA